MPRRPSDTVSTVRLELGVAEREALLPGLTMATVGIGASSIVAAAGIGLAGVAAFYTLRTLYGWAGTLKETSEKAGAAIGAASHIPGPLGVGAKPVAWFIDALT